LPIEETGILPALGLSYKHLSSNLKRCFAYCSILPKDYAFKKDKLVLLWMAEGFLPQPKNKTMEEVGDDYFLALVSRSLFQQSNHDEYIMHDLVYDLAKFISKQFVLSVEDGSSHEIGSKTRHFSYSWEHTHIQKFKDLHRAKRLRTIVELNFFGDDLSHMFGTRFLSPMIRCLRLRVLILSHYKDITELPDSIGKLIYLRYLDLSFTAIKRLPHFICKLCNLQILNLSQCPYLAALPRDMHKLINLQILNLSHCPDLAALPRDLHKLINLQILNLSHCPKLAAWPRDMHKLINLRHLDFAGTNIVGMPKNVGELKCLQTLTSFIVSKHNGSCNIGELGKLTNLRGLLPILELQNVESPMDDAKDGGLRAVKYLEKLVLEWRVGFNASESHVTVLDSLQAHTQLKSLVIYGYGGKSFPNWVGHASFSNITSLRLDYCNHCCSLPPLGQLPSLQDLSVVGLNEVVKMGREFYGRGSSSIKPFGALRVLSIKYMVKWEEWFSFENEGGAFPNLRELEIYECPMLTRGLPVHLPSLAKLKIRDCPRLVASALCELEIPTHLDYSSLEYLMLDGCDSLKSVPLDLFPKLRRLEIRFCGNLESLRVREQHEHDLLLSLIHIDIHGCPKFAYFPKEGLRSPNLKEFRIENCRGIRSLPDKMHILLPSLAKLYIQDCPEVESFPEGGLPSNLEEITILDCEKLFARRMGWDLQNLPSVRIFKVIGKSEDVESFPNEGLLPTSLIYLYINGFQNLRSLDKKGLQHLNALEELEIESCPELECMPEDGLPASLSTLNISNCPLLEKEWERKGEEWRKIAHVPHKSINFQLIY
jgi:Leucine-rich repeat (LRR) protein